MAILAFAHFNLRAPRELLEELRHFYVEVVGLHVGPRPPFDSFGYWLYAGTHDVLHLSESRPGEQRRAAADTTFDHVAFACANRQDFEQRLTTHGVGYRASSVPLTGQTQLFFADPAGNGVELNFAPE